MARKLSDAEFTERTRAANRRRTVRYQQRLSEAGKSSLTVWIPDAIKTALQTEAAERGSTLAETATALLSVALTTPNQTTTTPRASNDSTVDLFGDSKPGRPESRAWPTVPAPTLTKDERIQRILELKRTGLSNYAIGDQLGCSEATVRRALEPKKNASQTESTI